jgi:branched-chain amino acid transport system substrate-binding protein
MRRSPFLRTLFALLAIILVATSCGGRDDDDSSSGSGGGGGGTEAPSGGDEGDGEGGGLIDTSDCPDNATAGIEGNTIKLASSFPQSGLTAAFAQISRGYKAYFDKVNAEGGVEIAGEKYLIEVVDKDDEYNASKTVQNINELAGPDGDKAFAIFNVVGTANNIAIREAMGENCVPNIFAATGSPTWGNPDYPWLIGSTLAPYSLEAKAFADYLIEQKPDATVAMLVQDDDFGKAYEDAFRMAIEGTDIEVVQVSRYPAGANDVSSQITSLAATKADAFFNGSTLLACPNALEKAKAAGWDAITFVSGTCISKTLMGLAGENADGVIAATNIMDPIDPAYADHPLMVEYKETLAEYGASDVDPENGIVAYGYTQAAVLVEVLKGLDTLDRVSLMEAMHSIDEISGVGVLIDGVKIHTEGDDNFLAENLQLVQYDAAAAHFKAVGDVIDFEGKTVELTPEELIRN